MSELATYTFLPWLRNGIANQITGQQDGRATIPVELTLSGDAVGGNGQATALIQKDVQIYGPGDITGIDPKVIIKVEPRNYITNFETNYLPYIEFYDEDFPWRYSPLPSPGAGEHSLLPWLALIILKDNEFEEGKNVKDRPLPFISLTDATKLPVVSQLWAWAHVHINKDITGREDTVPVTDSNKIANELNSLLNQNPDLAYSRIMAPRKLEEKAAYHAFLVPSFETGRLAGLGNDPSGASATDMAWDAAANLSGMQLPYYHRWYFRTGTIGDFEYLVRLLEPKPVDSRVGRRDMDVQRPGANLVGLRDDPAADEEDKLNGILKLGGALRVPDIFFSPEEFNEVEKYRNWATLNNTQPYPHPFQQNIAAFINLTDGYEEEDAKTVNENSDVDQLASASNSTEEYDIKNNPDPLITAPLYGRWHALTKRLLKERDGTDLPNNDNWVHELNLDPRFRVGAGFGTKVIQQNQEDYMQAAWEQVGDIIKANQKIKQAQLALAASNVYHAVHYAPIQSKKPGKWLTISAPVQNRVVSEGFTVFHQKQESIVTLAPTSVNMRKLLKRRGAVVKRLPFNETIQPADLAIRINNGEVTAAPQKTAPQGIQTPKDLADQAQPDGVPPFIADLLKRYHWIKYVPLILALLVLLLIIPFFFVLLVVIFGFVMIGALVFAYTRLNKWAKQIAAADSILEENQTPESVDDLPKSPDFRITDPTDPFIPSAGSTDSEEAQRYKVAIKDANEILAESATLGEPIKRTPLNINRVNTAVFEGIRPSVTIPRWTFEGVVLPPFYHLQLREKERFVEAMAYPKFELPMYKPMVEHSAELFLPNINFVEQNSISLLETNQKFIEAYMVGLNHEFARELLWREYPTDQRGSYFRQFWETSGYLDTKGKQLNDLIQRYEAVLDQRNMPELQEQYDKLINPDVHKTPVFLQRAHRIILKEELTDIIPLHYWSKFSKLGDQDNRELNGDKEEEVVLVIRGELLKKYPNAVIYAHKAVWHDENEEPVLDNSQTIDVKQERTLYPLTAQQEADPPPDIVKTPLYEAKVDPDIYFFGFDLTVCEAKGGTGKEDIPVDERCSDTVNFRDAGWFFVIKERPGEPRFGLDIPQDDNLENGKVELWNDLSWSDVSPAVNDGDFLKINNQTQTITADQDLEPDDAEKETQQKEDINIVWSEDMNAAELAYILYQVPVLVAVHATEMLPDKF